MATNFYQVDFKTGNIYQYSKEAKEGFEEHKSNTGNVSYRRYLMDGLIGIYKGVSVRDSQFGKQLSVGVVDKNGDMCYMALPLWNEKKQMASFAESFTMYLPDLKANFIYRFFPYNIPAEDGSKRSKVGISIKHYLEDFETENGAYPVARLKPTYKDSATGEMVQGDVPGIQFVKAVDGSTEIDRREKDTYLYGVIEKYAVESVGGGSRKKVDNNAPAPRAVVGAEAVSAPAPQAVTTPQNTQQVAPAPQAVTTGTPAPQAPPVTTVSGPATDMDDLPF